MNQFNMMQMPQFMGMGMGGMDSSANMNMNMYGGNMPDMQSMGMNLFSGIYQGMTPNQMLGAQGKFPNQQGENKDNTSQ